MKHFGRRYRRSLLFAVVLALSFCLPHRGSALAYDAAPDWSNDACYGSGNPLTADNKYQCTWYAWGRTREVMGIRMSGLIQQWVNSSTTGGYMELPTTNSVAVYMNTATGWIYHVAYVENFDGTNVTYSEGNSWQGTGPQKYYRGTMELNTFEQKTLSWVKGATQIKYIPLGSVGTAPGTNTSGGTLKNGITWRFADGTLYFEGNGTIELGESEYFEKPWGQYTDAITTISLSAGITGIGDYALGNMDAANVVRATRIIGGENVVSVGKKGLYNMFYVQNWPFSSKLTSVGEEAFQSCREITGTLDLSNVTSIGTGAFEQMWKVEKVILSDRLAVLPYSAFYNMESLKEIRWQNPTLRTLSGFALAYVPITEFTIPDTVESIGEHCFLRTNLQSITIPAGVKSIGDGAFSQIAGLKTVCFERDAPQLGSENSKSVFGSGSPVVYYPAGNATWTAAISASADASVVWKAYSDYSAGSSRSGSLSAGGYPDLYRMSVARAGYYDVNIAAGSSADGFLEITRDPGRAGEWSSQQTDAWACTYLNAGTYYIRLSKSSYTFTIKEHFYHNDSSSDSPCGLHRCEYCGMTYHVPHTEGDWVVDVEPTVYREGSRHKACLLCGEIMETETLPKLADDVPAPTPTLAPTPTEPPVPTKAPEEVPFPAGETVSGVKAASAGYNSIRVKWEQLDGVTGYKIYRSVSKNGKYSLVKIVKSGGTTSWTEKNLTTGKLYYYKVRPYRSEDGETIEGDDSGAVSARPVPATVKITSVRNSSSGKAVLTWGKVTGASGYEIYRAGSNGKYRLVRTITKGKTVTWTNSGLAKGAAYTYKIRAYRLVDGEKVYGAASAVKSVKIAK